MANAKFTTASGVVVEISGTPNEVSAVLHDLERKSSDSAAPTTLRGKKRVASSKRTITDLIAELKTEEFFKTPKGLGEVRERLAELGHHYPVTTLSGAMQKESRRRSLRRFKQDGKFVYAQ